MDTLLLTDAVPGETYFIQKIGEEERLINRLSSMGILKGTEIEICQNNKKQPILLFTRDTLVAVGKTESKKIVIGGGSHE